MFCKKCGAQLKEGAKFCEKCGARIEENHVDIAGQIGLQSNTQETVKINKKKKSVNPIMISILVSMVIFVIGVIGIAGFLVKNHIFGQKNPLLIKVEDVPIDFSQPFDDVMKQIDDNNLVACNAITMMLSNGEKFKFGEDNDIAVYYFEPKVEPAGISYENVEASRFDFSKNFDFETAQGVSESIDEEEAEELLENYLRIKYKNDSVAYTTIYVDGKQMTEEELEKYIDEVEDYIDEDDQEGLVKELEKGMPIFHSFLGSIYMSILTDSHAFDYIDINAAAILLAGSDHIQNMEENKKCNIYMITYVVEGDLKNMSSVSVTALYQK